VLPLPAALPVALPVALPLVGAGAGAGASFLELHAVLHTNTAPKASFDDNFMLAR